MQSLPIAASSLSILVLVSFGNFAHAFQNTPLFSTSCFSSITLPPSTYTSINRNDRDYHLHLIKRPPFSASSPFPSSSLSAKKKKKKGGGGGSKSKSKGGFAATTSGFASKPPPPPKQCIPSTALSSLTAPSPPPPKPKPYVKSDQEALLAQLTASSAGSPIGRAVAESPNHGTPDADPFYEFLPSLIGAKFPLARDEELERVAGFVRHALDPELELEEGIVNDPWRPHTEIHAYMPSLPPTKPFHPPTSHPLSTLLSTNLPTILSEYEALLTYHSTLPPNSPHTFQSVTSMNYDAGWKTLVLFYNGHRIDGFPYHLCPVTTEILESVPLAGRIAGFNRQEPQSGIPLHSDGNNMWLTCQMGLKVPEWVGGEPVATIRVGPERRGWREGECLLYDTTYEHETWNGSESEERVVLHVDFFNTLSMTELEIQVMRYVYSMREEFMKAEGVGKVGAQIL